MSAALLRQNDAIFLFKPLLAEVITD